MNLKIKTQNNEFEFEKEAGTKIKEIIKSEGINFKFPCGGRGACGKCKVIVKNGIQSPTASDEKKISKDDLELGTRLACGLELNNDMEIELKEKDSSLLGYILGRNKK